MRLIGHILFFLFILITTSEVIYSQASKQIKLSKYNQQNGLSSFNIHKIVQDPFGFVWIATQDGLNRFDGKNFVEYNKNTKDDRHNIIAPDCRDLYVDSVNDLLWVLANEGGLNAVNYRTGRVERTILRRSNNPDDWAISFEFANDRFWIGTGRGVSVFNTKTGAFEASPLDSMLKGLNSVRAQVRLCQKDRFGNVWVCINGVGIAIINSVSKKIIKLIPIKDLRDLSKAGIIQFFTAIESNGSFIFGTSQGMRAISFGGDYTIKINNAPCQSIPILNSTVINWVGKGLEGKIYISSDKLFSFTDQFSGPVEYHEPPNSIENWFSSVSTGLFINNNLLLLGCKDGLGIMKLSESAFKSVSNGPLLDQKLSHVYGLWPYSEDSILVAANSGLHLITHSRNIKTILGDGYYQNISALPGDVPLVSNSQGIKTVVNNVSVALSKIYDEFKPFQHWEINSCVRKNDSIYILGTENFSGILIWNTRERKVTPINQTSSPLKTGADIVNTVYRDSKDKVWVLSDKVITIIDEKLQHFSEVKFKDSISSLPVGLFFDICEAQNYYWIATYGTGIIQLDSAYRIKKIFTVKDGLSNSGVYKVFNYGNKKLFITTNNGLSVLNLENYTFNNYYQEDGLHSNAFEEACGVYRNNKIYAGGVGGFTIIDPEIIPENKIAPLLYISAIETETSSGKIDSSNLAIKQISIPNNFTQTKIYFSALNYFNPLQTIYKYRISELHSDWIDLQTQNFITLIGLSPGTYHLHVQAFNEIGIPSEIKELTLVFLPRWYQTWWFRLSIVLLFIGCIYGIYRIRINRLKHVQEIRNKLARDLHDDLGSTMNSVKVYANLAIMEKHSDKYLSKIRDGAQEAIIGIRDIIWVLDDRKDRIEHLLARIGAFAIPLCEANNIQYKQEISDNARDHKLGQEERRNLYMMLKEAVNNATKYSEGQKIEIEILVIKGKPRIQIKDDGKGFFTEATNEGNGLQNMKRRAKEVNYTITIESALGMGTVISLQKT